MNTVYTSTRNAYRNTRRTEPEDSDTKIHATLQSAIASCEMTWSHLTKREQQYNELYAGYTEVPDNITDADDILEYIFTNGIHEVRTWR